MSVAVDFGQWGVQALAPGGHSWWWYSWIFDGSHWAEFTAVPQPWSPANGSIQKVEQWATNGVLHVHWFNNGSDYVYFAPTVIVAPSRY